VRQQLDELPQAGGERRQDRVENRLVGDLLRAVEEVVDGAQHLLRRGPKLGDVNVGDRGLCHP
jgi:hypothetical protein